MATRLNLYILNNSDAINKKEMISFQRLMNMVQDQDILIKVLGTKVQIVESYQK